MRIDISSQSITMQCVSKISDRQVCVRGTTKEVRMWRARARASGMSISVWMRNALNAGPIYETKPLAEPDKEQQP